MRKQLIIIGIIVMLAIVGLSGCFETQKESEKTETIKTIEISGMGVTQTVNYVEKPVKLIVSGMNCDITVTKETNLTEVVISGMDSIVRVSHSHSFTSDISGLDAQVVYYD